MILNKRGNLLNNAIIMFNLLQNFDCQSVNDCFDEIPVVEKAKIKFVKPSGRRVVAPPRQSTKKVIKIVQQSSKEVT